MNILDFIKVERNNRNMKYYFTAQEDIILNNIVIINKIIYDNNITIRYNYTINKNDFYNIIIANYENKKYIVNFPQNYNLNFCVDFLNSMNFDKFEKIFQNYLLEISYEKNEKQKGLIKGENNSKKAYQELFYNDKFKINIISYIIENEKTIGYGLFDLNHKNHYIILSENDIDDFYNYSIYRYGSEEEPEKQNSKKTILNEVNNILDDIFINYFKTVPTYDITGNPVYRNIKLFILNNLKTINREFKMIRNINDINNVFTKMQNSDDIIYIIKLYKHLSLLLKLDNSLISLDTSAKHLQLLNEANNNQVNKVIILHFSRPIQNSGACTYYTIKFLEEIKDMKKNDILNEFKNNSLLIKTILLLNDFFISIDNMKYISSEKTEICSLKNNFNIQSDKISYFMDDNFFLNKFIKIRSLYKCLQLEIPENMKELLEAERKIFLVNEIIKQRNKVNKNLEIFPKFIKEIKNKKNSNYTQFFIECFKDFLDKNFGIYEEEKENVSKLIIYAKEILSEKKTLFEIEFNPSIKNILFQLTVLKNFDGMTKINNYYEQNIDNFRFLRTLSFAFKNLGENSSFENKFEEENSFIL